MAREYDFVIIGGGAAGFACAVKLSELGKGRLRVAMVNDGKLGGTCVNVGCVPSKALIEAAKAAYGTSWSKIPGIRKEVEIGFGDVMNWVRRIIADLRREKYESLVERLNGVELIEGRASFRKDGTVTVEADDEVLLVKGRKYLVATGSRPAIPPIEGLREVGYMTSDDVWEMREKPDSLMVIGAGAVGVEIGQAMNRLGVQVSMVEVLDRVLPGMEPEISRVITEVLGEEGIRVFTKTRVVRVTRKGERKVVELVTGEGRKVEEVDQILVATGRRPNTDGLNLESLGVRIDRRGFVETDSTMRTSNPQIYAAGDVVSKRWMLETLAAREGVVAALNMYGERAEMDYTGVPLVVFTEPQVASIGLTEEEAVKELGGCSCRTLDVSELPKARITGQRAGIAKVVVDPSTGRVIGYHIVSPNAAEFALAASLFVRLGFTVEDVLWTHSVFPTFSESLKLVATKFIRAPELMPCCME
ncbi:MAG: mercury(II) reductase [Nitrososphaerota archaeon]|nr:mercury(II) reductase [Candidatus Calditenuis fumarioli]